MSVHSGFMIGQSFRAPRSEQLIFVCSPNHIKSPYYIINEYIRRRQKAVHIHFEYTHALRRHHYLRGAFNWLRAIIVSNRETSASAISWKMLNFKYINEDI